MPSSPRLPWYDDQECCNLLLDSVITKSEELAWVGMNQFGIPEEYIPSLIATTGNALDFLNGKKWGYHLISALFFKEKVGFAELSTIIEGISNRALATRLKESVAMNLVKLQDSLLPMRTRYSLTEHGRIVATLLTPLVYYMKRESGTLNSNPFSENE